MSTTPRTRSGASDVTTLGDLLYADTTKPRVGEQEWSELLTAIAAGDQLALDKLYERAHRPVFTLIVRIVNDRATAEELTLDVFHDVWRRAAQYDAVAGGSVLGWIMNQARSRAIDRLRFEQRKKRVNVHADDDVAVTTPDDADVNLSMADQSRVLREALTVLTYDERQVIETAFFSELTYAQVAMQLNQPLGTVKTRIRSALVKLREALATRAQEL